MKLLFTMTTAVQHKRRGIVWGLGLPCKGFGAAGQPIYM